MKKRLWWIYKPVLRASSNPSDADLARLRKQGFRVAVSLLDEKKQRPRYNKESASRAGWSIYPIPIKENAAPSMKQIVEFMKRLRRRKKALVFCESGLGRSAFMGAAYLIGRGFSAKDAIDHVVVQSRRRNWLTKKRKALLHNWTKLQGSTGKRNATGA